MASEPWRKPVDKELLRAAAEALGSLIDAHSDHPWHVISRCVYCGPCGLRLFQGRVPDGHPVYTPPPSQSVKASNAMRERWNKNG